MIRPLVNLRVNGEIQTADVLAACKVAGYTFLIHRAHGNQNEFVATYAPVGLGCAPQYSVAECIADLEKRADVVPDVINNALRNMERDHFPLLSSEYGIETNDWKWREQCRFDSGEYQPVPDLGLEYPPDHFLHLSVTKQETDFVAYTPSEAYGIADRQVRMKFGKYLKKTFDWLSDAGIQEYVTRFKAILALAEQPTSIHFATDRETINEIFETCMNACDSTSESCMYNKFTHLTTRPYHVYADSPDVAVAYLRNGDGIVARSVVSTKDKSYVRLYSRGGDSALCQMLRDQLMKLGYHKGDLSGNRLTKLNTKRVMLPYIDGGANRVTDAGKYWEVSEYDGEYTADNTDGSATGDDEPCCDTCHRPEEDCECYTCECCESRTRYGCDECSMCPACDSCTEHGGCNCDRCSNCGNLLDPPRGCDGCECDRCCECNELDRDCDCDKCDECNRLTTDCECTPDEKTEEATECAQS